MSRIRNIPKCSGPHKATGDGFRLLAPGWLLAPDPFSFLSQASNPQDVEWPTWIWALFLGTLPYRRHWGQIKYVEPLWTLVSKFAVWKGTVPETLPFQTTNPLRSLKGSLESVHTGIISAALVLPAAKPGPSRLSEVLISTLHGPSNPASLPLHLLSKALSLLYPSGQHLTVRLLTLPCPLSHPGPLDLSSGLLHSTADPRDKRDLLHICWKKKSDASHEAESEGRAREALWAPDSLPATLLTSPGTRSHPGALLRSRRLAHIPGALLTSRGLAHIPAPCSHPWRQEDRPPPRLGHRRPLSGGKLP